MKDLEHYLKGKKCTYPDPETCPNYCRLFQVCTADKKDCSYHEQHIKPTTNIQTNHK